MSNIISETGTKLVDLLCASCTPDALRGPTERNKGVFGSFFLIFPWLVRICGCRPRSFCPMPCAGVFLVN